MIPKSSCDITQRIREHIHLYCVVLQIGNTREKESRSRSNSKRTNHSIILTDFTSLMDRSARQQQQKTDEETQYASSFIHLFLYT